MLHNILNTFLFPRYLSSIHSNCEDISVRQEILDNLIDEERGNDNHLSCGCVLQKEWEKINSVKNNPNR